LLPRTGAPRIMRNYGLGSTVRLARVVVVALGMSTRVLADESSTMKIDLGGGYAFMRSLDTFQQDAPPHDVSRSFPAGWFVTTGIRATERLVLAGEFVGDIASTHYQLGQYLTTSNPRAFALVGGPRIVFQSGRNLIYGQLLIGAAALSRAVTVNADGSLSHAGTQTFLCLAPGVGIDLAVSSQTSLRLGGNARLVDPGANAIGQLQLVVGIVRRF
jgi:hypothetical protein